jgi:serine phosphatase RsbU (regulator of sigma subunit)/anti-sigma regulatory factor (Ser/Thr protein kinase)
MAAPLLQPERPAAFRVAFPLNLPSARAAAAAIRAFLAEHKVSENELFACESCLVEACNNAVEYLGESGRDRLPTVEAIYGSAQIELRVTDHTPGFNWPKKVVLPPPSSERGRGLFIIYSTMTEVSYMRGTDENVLVMRLTRSGGDAPSAEGSATLSADEARRQLVESKRTTEGLVRELAFRSEVLSMIFRWCGELGRPNETTGFEMRLLQDILRLTAADWYVLRLISPTTRDLTVAAVSVPEWLSGELDLPAIDAPPRGIEATVAASQESVAFDARKYLGPLEPLRMVGPEARGMVCPLCFGGTLVGTLAVGRLHADFSFNELPAEVMRIFSSFIALQTMSLNQREEAVQNRLMARELEIGRKIQQALLPSMLPDLPGFNLSGGCQSAREIGGDFYDAVALSDDSLLLMMADVMGKGVPAALFATHVRGILRGLSVRTEDPAQFLNRLNRVLFAELSAVGMFVTALVVVVDLKERQITAASAGHCPPLFIANGSAEVVALKSKGIPLGILPDTVYHSETAILGTPGLLFLYTDGLTEASNPQGELFGQQRLMAWLSDNNLPGRSATELRGRLLAELNNFRGGNALTDDQTFLLLSEEARAPRNPALSAAHAAPLA